jgi:hypothetical protein
VPGEIGKAEEEEEEEEEGIKACGIEASRFSWAGG